MESGNLDVLRWLCDELYEEYVTQRDTAVIQKGLSGLASLETEMILGELFWRALEADEVTFAEHCLELGVPIAPSEISESGPIHTGMARLGDRPDVITWLLDRGAEVERRDLNNGNATPLIAAVGYGVNCTVELLLARGADVNATTVVDNNETALIVAVKTLNEDSVRMLLESGADIRHRDRWGRSAVAVAEEKRCKPIRDLLKVYEAQ